MTVNALNAVVKLAAKAVVNKRVVLLFVVLKILVGKRGNRRVFEVCPGFKNFIWNVAQRAIDFLVHSV